MSEPRIVLELDEHHGPYWPGEIISGQFRLEACETHDVRAMELSVLWYTVGQGEEDLAVHHFARRSAEESTDVHSQRFDLAPHQRFKVVLPNSPLSYDGILVKIRWAVRLRAFLAQGREIVVEKPFQLGAIPPAHLVPS
jgi:hypothetical protein